VNFGEWAQHILERLHAEILRNPDDRLADLHAELKEHVSCRTLEPGHLGFAVPLRLHSAEGELNLITTVTTFATAVDITLAELKLEAFLPTDEITSSILSRTAHKSAGEAATAQSGGSTDGLIAGAAASRRSVHTHRQESPKNPD
jgi:hypothetical protein